MRKTFKYRLYRNKNTRHLVAQIHAAASVWNHCVALTRRYYRRFGKSLSVYRLMGHIGKRRRNNPFWQHLGSQAVQDVCQRLDLAYQRFFADPKVGRPSFKKSRAYSSFTLKQAGWKYLEGNRIRIGNHLHKFVLSRPLEGDIKTVTIKRDRCGDLWLCFSVVVPDSPPMTAGSDSRVVGLDFGLRTFLTTSDGERYHAPQPFRRSMKQMRARQRSLKAQGSTHRRRERLRVARLHRHIADSRRDWHFKTAHSLCDAADQICLEDLNLKGMQALWGRKVGDLGYGQFVGILEHLAAKRGKTVVKVGRFYPSSKTCSGCGSVNHALLLSEREWVCPSCGIAHDRDINAAVNIRREGASSLRREGVRLGLPSGPCLSRESHVL